MDYYVHDNPVGDDYSAVNAGPGMLRRGYPTATPESNLVKQPVSYADISGTKEESILGWAKAVENLGTFWPALVACESDFPHSPPLYMVPNQPKYRIYLQV